ncbi:MAG TPA: HEAT repeat domain-containing protein [Planctomycetota bacterium]|nr:HEAT repeat domain-containing protein [Planctomycetota bacterium]
MAQWTLLMALLSGAQDQPLNPAEDLGLRIAAGFKVSLYSGPEVANDIYAMTLDPQGRVVVTSQGWIKLLHDDGHGKADRATLLAPTRTGGMGMCFDGNDLLFSGDHGLWRFRDIIGNGAAEGKPEKISSFVSGEHGHHAIRKGPDGWWYLIGGNEARFTKEQITLPHSPVKNPEVGAILRYRPGDFTKSEIVAHGFRNPYDFDWNEAGDLFTYDSDCERDFGLPWYTPTRIYHVGSGMNHGWRLRGHQRSFARRDYYIDTVDMLWPVGRGSPTGVTIYRHHQFPERYRGGLFALDWTFGKIYFFPLKPKGATYSTNPELFLEPAGSEGFAPTDICVAPDGSLYVSIGGRHTRGAVYRIEYAGREKTVEPATDLEKVLRAPQPLDAWSRARWEPLARKLGAEPFLEAYRNPGRSSGEQVRAIEIVTELFPGPHPILASQVSSLNHPDAAVRARIAWSLGRDYSSGYREALKSFARDADARVRRAALESLGSNPEGLDAGDVSGVIVDNLDHPDRRVRQAAARLAAVLPGSLWSVVDAACQNRSPQVRLSRALAAYWRREVPDFEVARVLESVQEPELRLEAVRLLMIALGDQNIEKPAVEVYSCYAPAIIPTPEVRERILRAVRPLFPSRNPTLDLESSRLLGMLEDGDDETVKRTAAFLSETSPAAEDVHYLAVLSRLKGQWPADLPRKVVNTLLRLDRKLEGQEQRNKLTWSLRLAELTSLFVQRDPRTAEEFLRHPLLISPDHVSMAAALGGEFRKDASRRFLEAVKQDPGFPWSESLLDLLDLLPPEETIQAFRGQGSNLGLRDAIILRLGRTPMKEDRDLFLGGVESANSRIVSASLDALAAIGQGGTSSQLLPCLRLLRRLTQEPKEAALRSKVARLIGPALGLSTGIQEENGDPIALKRAYQPLFEEFLRRNPGLRSELDRGGEDLTVLLKDVPWENGDRARGEALFRARGCQTCHAVQGALGPNLAGAANRFSREDLFEAIVNPSKDVAPPYRTTSFQLKDGQVHTGIIAFESADGYIVQTGATTTVRINTPEIAAMRPSATSLMPESLLKNLKSGDLADLYSYLRSLTK